MEVIKDKYNWVVFVLIILAILLACSINVGCTPHKYIYKIEFSNGDVEYFELNYKPKENSKSIEYNGETILDVNKIEKID
jgi:hypothetical protein